MCIFIANYKLWLEDLSLKMWFLTIILLANIHRMELVSRWSGREKEVVFDVFYGVLFGADFDEYIFLVEGFCR